MSLVFGGNECQEAKHYSEKLEVAARAVIPRDVGGPLVSRAGACLCW